MTWLPVVERELRVAARRRATYRVRFWAVLIMSGFFAYQMMDAGNRNGNTAQAGRNLFSNSSLLSFLFAISIGVIATSDSVSEEKREGTLGLLFLTDLKGYDVILGKLVAHSINAFYALVAILPVLGMPLLMGGVTFLQFVKLVVALVSAIVFSLSAGIYVSTRSLNERKAMVFTFLMLLVVTCGPFLILFQYSGPGTPKEHLWCSLMFSPAFAVGMAIDSPPFWPAASYWCGVAMSWIGAAILLFDSAGRVPRSWTQRVAKPRVTRTTSAKRILLDGNPFLWLAMRGEASQTNVWLFVGSILGLWLIGLLRYKSVVCSFEVVWPTVIILHTGLKIWVAGEASRRFMEDRQNNAMEFLLSTPLRETQIIQGQWVALARQFLGPVLALLVWETIAAFVMKPHQWGNDELFVPQLICAMFFLPLDILALGWIGMLLGMKCKSRGKAMCIGLGLVLVIPVVWSKLFDPGVWSSASHAEWFHLSDLVSSSLLIDIVGLFWAQRRLLNNFRPMALATFSR